MEEQFEEELQFEKIDLHVWKKILKIIISQPRSIVNMFFAVLFLTILDIGYPILNTYTFQIFFSENANFTNQTIYIFAGMYILVAILTGVSVYLFIKASSAVEEKTTHVIRMKAFEKLQELSFAYFDNTPSGWIMARMTSDCRKLASIVSWGLVDIVWGCSLVLGIMIASFVIYWPLALVFCVLLPVFLLVAMYFRKKILNEYREVRKINSKITASYNESFMGANTTKTLVLEQDNELEFNSLVTSMRRRSIKASMIRALFWPSIIVIGYFGVAFIYGFGASLIIKNIILIPQLYLFVEFTTRFFDPILQISSVLSDFQQAQASAERVIGLIETTSDIVDTDEVQAQYGTLFDHKKTNWETIKGDIVFENVSFKYKNTDVYVLQDFSLHIKAGQMVALVGDTGCGKSTIVNLISRFYEPTTGRILIDGRNYQDRSVAWLHAHLGYVLQTPQLFSTSVKDNIRYGKLEASDEEIIRAATIANAHPFIMKLDQQYDTLIGEGGNKLSLGEKQLVSFARAIIRDPAILVLDEATSSIDTENEKKILEAMQSVLKGRTSIVVAHRLSTIVDADVIIVLKNGKIVEQGTHKELLNLKGRYFELYKNQFLQELEQQILNE